MSEGFDPLKDNSDLVDFPGYKELEQRAYDRAAGALPIEVMPGTVVSNGTRTFVFTGYGWLPTDLVKQVEELQQDVRNKQYLMAAMVYMSGGEVKITPKLIAEMPANGVLHEHRNPETQELTIRFAKTEEN